MKIATIRKALVKQTAVTTVILIFSGAAIWFLGSLDEEYNNDINQLMVQANNVTKQAMDLTSEYSKVTSVMDLYNEIKKKQDNKMLTVNKIALRDAIVEPKNKYYLDDLDVKMDVIKALEGEKYKRETALIESSTATASLNALTDLDIFGLVKSLQSSFSGIKFTYLKITLSKELDSNSLIAIKDTGFSPIVSGKINFTLFGIRGVSAEGDLLTEGDSNVQNNPVNNRRRIRLRQP